METLALSQLQPAGRDASMEPEGRARAKERRFPSRPSSISCLARSTLGKKRLLWAIWVRLMEVRAASSIRAADALSTASYRGRAATP